jgi:hypothetical protein
MGKNLLILFYFNKKSKILSIYNFSSLKDGVFIYHIAKYFVCVKDTTFICALIGVKHLAHAFYMYHTKKKLLL